MAIIKHSDAQIDSVFTDEEEVKDLSKEAIKQEEEIKKALARIEQELKERNEHGNN